MPCSHEVTTSPAASNRPGSMAAGPDPVVAGPGNPGPGLQVAQGSPVGAVQHLLERLLPPGPVRGGVGVTGQAGTALVLPDRGVQHRDRLGERDRYVGIGGGLPGRLRLALQLDQPLGSGVRLGGLQPGQVLGERRIPAPCTPQPGAGARVDLLVHRVIRIALDNLAWCKAEGPGAWSPPAAGRFSFLGGVEVVPAGGAFGGMVLGFPDVAEVVALGDSDDHGQYGCLPPAW